MHSRLLVLLLIAFEVLSASASRAQWLQVRAGSAANRISCVYFNDAGVGFLGLTSPTGDPVPVWRSTDSGTTWEPTSVDYTHTAFGYPLPEDFTFKDSNTGWFASRVGIYRTDDGGRSWFFAGSSTPGDGARAIWYDRAGRVLMRSSWDSGPMFYSTNDGASWQIASTVTSFAPNGFAQLHPTTIIAGNGAQGLDFYPIIRSRDHGRTWQDLPVHTECWQPFYDSTRRYLLLGMDKAPKVYKSTDDGDSWREITAFTGALDQSTGCIRGDSRGNVYAQTIYSGFYRSTDEGESWESICGPDGNVDTRFTIFADRLFTGDQWGNLWMLDLTKSNKITLDSGLTLSATSCDPVSRYLHLGAFYTCDADVTVDSVTVAGLAFSVSEIPTDVGSEDSVLITYAPSALRDSAIITFYLRRNGSAIDTSIVVYATSASTANQPAELGLTAPDGSRSMALAPGDNGSFSLRAINPLPKELQIHTIHFTLRVSDALRIGSVSPLSGWRALTLPTGGNVLETTLSRDEPIDIAAGEEIARIAVRSYLTLDTTADAVLTEYTFNPDEVFIGCLPLALAPDSVLVRIPSGCGDGLIRQYLRTGSPLWVTALYPEPASWMLHVSLSGPALAATYDISDDIGRIVISGVLTSKEIDLSSLHSGRYYLRVAHGGLIASRGFVVRK